MTTFELKALSTMPAASTLDGTETVPVVQGGVTKKTTASALAALAGAGLTTEQVQDTVAAMIVAGSNITATYDDPAGTLTLTSSGGSGASGTGWVLANQWDCASALSDWTQSFGTWSQGAGFWENTATAAALTLKPTDYGLGAIRVEAEFQNKGGGGGNSRLGIMRGDATQTGSAINLVTYAVGVVHVAGSYSGAGVGTVLDPASNNGVASSPVDTWFKLEATIIGSHISARVDNVAAGQMVSGVDAKASNCIAIWAQDGGLRIRNIKIYKLSGGGGGTTVTQKVTQWAGAGSNLTTSSTSFATIDATNIPALSLTLAVGDVVDLELLCTIAMSAGSALGFDWLVDRPISADTNLRGSAWAAYIFEPGNAATDANTHRASGTFVATEAGVHSFLPQWRVSASTAAINLTGTYWGPVKHSIRNFGPLS